MPIAAFSPAHLTGFFKIYRNTSAGGGVTLQQGMLTEIKASTRGKTKIFINGIEGPAPVSNWVLSKYSRQMDAVPLEIRHKTPIPIGCGLGMSAAGALSLSLAMNEWCGRPYSHKTAVKIAHDADVACGTGLASVDVQAIGGLVSRRGGSGRPDVFRLSPTELRTPITLAVYGPIRTASIIKAKGWAEKVNSAGSAALKKFYTSPSISSLSLSSNSFAVRSGLSKWCGNFLQGNQNIGMAMLGKTLFSNLLFIPPHIRGLPKPDVIATYPCARAASLVF